MRLVARRRLRVLVFVQIQPAPGHARRPSGPIRCPRPSRPSAWRGCKSCWKPKGRLTISRQSVGPRRSRREAGPASRPDGRQVALSSAGAVRRTELPVGRDRQGANRTGRRRQPVRGTDQCRRPSRGVKRERHLRPADNVTARAQKSRTCNSPSRRRRGSRNHPHLRR